MVEQGPPGTVRVSPDRLGLGLYSDDGLYRYWFLTEVESHLRPGDAGTAQTNRLPVITPQTLVWVGLNPSQSDDNGKHRSSLATVLAWAKLAGLSRVLGVNLYAYRHTDPENLKERLKTETLEDVIGAGNDQLLGYVAAAAEHVLLAWGVSGHIGARGSQVAKLFPTGQCVGVCANGEPWHPGRKKHKLPFFPYRPVERSLP